MEQSVDLDLVIDNLPSAIVVVDRARRIRLANRMAAHFCESTQGELLGLRGGEAFRCVHSRTAPEGCGFAAECRHCVVRGSVLSTFAGREGTAGVETSMHFLHAGERNLRLSTTYLPAGEEEMVLLAIEDVTDLRRMEGERLEREKLEAVLATVGTICHELNQPMQIAASQLEMLLDEPDPGPGDPGALEGVRDQIFRMGTITRRLMGITFYRTKGYLTRERPILDLEEAPTGEDGDERDPRD